MSNASQHMFGCLWQVLCGSHGPARHDLNWSKGQDQGKVLQLNIDQSGNSFNSHLEKQFILILPNQPNLPKPIKIVRGNPHQEIVGALQEKPSSSDRPGRPVSKEEQHVLNHDKSGKRKTAHSARRLSSQKS